MLKQLFKEIIALPRREAMVYIPLIGSLLITLPIIAGSIYYANPQWGDKLEDRRKVCEVRHALREQWKEEMRYTEKQRRRDRAMHKYHGIIVSYVDEQGNEWFMRDGKKCWIQKHACREGRK